MFPPIVIPHFSSSTSSLLDRAIEHPIDPFIEPNPAQAHPPKILISKNLIRYFSFPKPAPPFLLFLPLFFILLALQQPPKFLHFSISPTFPRLPPDSKFLRNSHSSTIASHPTHPPHDKPKHTQDPNHYDPLMTTPLPPLSTMDFPLPTLPLNTPSYHRCTYPPPSYYRIYTLRHSSLHLPPNVTIGLHRSLHTPIHHPTTPPGPAHHLTYRSSPRPSYKSPDNPSGYAIQSTLPK